MTERPLCRLFLLRQNAQKGTDLAGRFPGEAPGKGLLAQLSLPLSHLVHGVLPTSNPTAPRGWIEKDRRAKQRSWVESRMGPNVWSAKIIPSWGSAGETSAEVKQKSGETQVIQNAFSPPGCPRFPIQAGRELREEVRHWFLSSLSPWVSRLGCLGLRSSRGELADLKKGRGSWQC